MPTSTACAHLPGDGCLFCTVLLGLYVLVFMESNAMPCVLRVTQGREGVLSPAPSAYSEVSHPS